MKFLFSLFFLSYCTLYSSNSYCFNFTASPTNETCSGNGKIDFSVSDTDPNGTILYVIYLLPDTITPYATTSNSFLNGLSSGTYRIIAREIIGTSFTTQQIDVTVSNSILPLTYSISCLNQTCSSNSTISIDVNLGNAVSYEIFNGPVTFPLQSSNTFSNLPIGVYKIRVFDTCGVGVVTTYTVTNNPTGLSVTLPNLSNTTCNSTDINQIITPAVGTVIAYPLTLQYTIHPPTGGSDILINQIITSGDLFSLPIFANFPVYTNQNYTCDLLITDGCNMHFTYNYIINTTLNLSVSIIVLPCDSYYFTLNTTNFTSTYTLNFTSFPTGFNPILFNSIYPGPFSTNMTDFGSPTNTVPLGDYEVAITDSCGSTKSITFSILSKPPQPSVSVSNNGCLSSTGTITAIIPGYNIVSAIITNAPITYPNSLQDNVSSQIVNGELTLDSLPLGDYTLEIVDDCTYTVQVVTVTVPIYVDKGVKTDLRPGCELGKGSLKLWSKNGKLISVRITTAPATYSFALPNDVSNAIIGTGILYLDNLPSGVYTFNTIDECNFSRTFNVTIVGYSISSSSYSLVANCGSFDLSLEFVSNGTANQSFWLQKLIEPSTNEWGNPFTDVVYPDNSIPNATNSLLLNNLTTNYNLSFNGTFRIIRHFLSYTNGILINNSVTASVNKSCIEILTPTLSFNESLELLNCNRTPCTSSGSLDVIVNAIGKSPLRYTITQKNGVSFLFDNGNSNIFYSLPSATYMFQIEDSCGNIVNRIIDVNSLNSLVLITKPNDMLICTNQISQNEVFDLTTQNPTILGSQSPQEYTLTYFETYANAQNNTNAINNITNYNPISNPATIYARLVFNGLPTCYEITSFDLYVGQNPSIKLDENYLFCNQNTATIYDLSINLPSTSYLWSNGATTHSVNVTTAGFTELTLTTTNTYGPQNLSCNTSKNITVILSELPVLDHIETFDWTEQSNSIKVITSNTGAYEYSLDNSNFQDSNLFSNLTSGLYTVYIRDKAGCGTLEQTVWLLYYKKYFTPNSDGYNETWRIPFSENEKELKVIVYDRYGKVITSFDSNSVGWDGTYNGTQLISDDYWFVVYRADGRIHKGHFCLKR